MELEGIFADRDNTSNQKPLQRDSVARHQYEHVHILVFVQFYSNMWLASIWNVNVTPSIG